MLYILNLQLYLKYISIKVTLKFEIIKIIWNIFYY